MGTEIVWTRYSNIRRDNIHEIIKKTSRNSYDFRSWEVPRRASGSIRAPHLASAGQLRTQKYFWFRGARGYFRSLNQYNTSGGHAQR